MILLQTASVVVTLINHISGFFSDFRRCVHVEVVDFIFRIYTCMAMSLPWDHQMYSLPVIL